MRQTPVLYTTSEQERDHKTSRGWQDLLPSLQDWPIKTASRRSVKFLGRTTRQLISELFGTSKSLQLVYGASSGVMRAELTKQPMHSSGDTTAPLHAMTRSCPSDPLCDDDPVVVVADIVVAHQISLTASRLVGTPRQAMNIATATVPRT